MIKINSPARFSLLDLFPEAAMPMAWIRPIVDFLSLRHAKQRACLGQTAARRHIRFLLPPTSVMINV